MKSFALFLTMLFSTLLYSQTSEIKIITLEPQMSFQNYEHFKRLTLQSPNSPIEYLEGFTFEWGYRYTLRVQQTKLDPPLSDGTKYFFSLIDIILKTKVPDSTKFKLIVDPSRYYGQVDSNERDLNKTLQQINDSTYIYFDEVEIIVPSNLKTEFKQIIDSQVPRVGYFAFSSEKRIRLLGF